MVEKGCRSENLCFARVQRSLEGPCGHSWRGPDQAVFHAPAAELQLNWTRALTPRLSPEDMADLWKDKEVARAAAPVTMVQLKEGCTSSSSYVKTGEPLGEGGVESWKSWVSERSTHP